MQYLCCHLLNRSCPANDLFKIYSQQQVSLQHSQVFSLQHLAFLQSQLQVFFLVVFSMPFLLHFNRGVSLNNVGELAKPLCHFASVQRVLYFPPLPFGANNTLLRQNLKMT